MVKQVERDGFINLAKTDEASDMLEPKEGFISRREFLTLSSAIGLAYGFLPLVGHGAIAEAQELERVLLRLSWIPSGKDSAFYAAKAQGFWAKNGIDVNVRPGTGDADVCKLVGLARDDFGISGMDGVIKARIGGIPVKMLGMHLPKPPQSIVSKTKAGIKVPKDLEGKTLVGSPASGMTRLLPAFFKKNGVDESKVKVNLASPGSWISLLLEDKVDAIPAFLMVEVAALKGQGWEEGKNLNIIRFEDWGFPDILSLGFITSDEYLQKKRDLVKRFIPPCLEGIRYAMKNPEDAVNELLKVFPEMNKVVLLDGLQHSFKLMNTKEAAENTLGWISKEKVEFTQNLLFETGQIEKKLPVEEFFTNEFLTGPAFKG